jgi:hypothetical protein
LARLASAGAANHKAQQAARRAMVTFFIMAFLFE